MVKIFIIILFLFLNGCSTFKKDVVKCPKVVSPRKAAELVINSEKNQPIYVGFRGVPKLCFEDGDDIQMQLSVNIRAIRNDTTQDDYVPVNISVVSIDSNEKEFDRDEFNYSQFLLKGSKIVDRATTFDLQVPDGGKVLLGIR